jgi:hypothetical protein
MAEDPRSAPWLFTKKKVFFFGSNSDELLFTDMIDTRYF